MPSTFSWLDYSDHERRKVLDVVELFGEKTTVDEIGIGSVRDAIADAWFPGTSTIQTTAKYFFLVPWTYINLEHRSVGSDRIADYARKIEIKTIQALVDAGTKNGVIGRIAKESLQRLPSGVYWQGLLTWGIRRTDRSQDVLLYNIILAEMQKWDEQVERFRETWIRWAELMDQRRNQIHQWDLERFWMLVDKPSQRVSPTVKRFIEAWIQLVRSSNHARELWDNNPARELIKIRERQIKKGLARILGGRPLELWRGESGSAQLDFRWRNTRRIYLDIQKGLQGS